MIRNIPIYVYQIIPKTSLQFTPKLQEFYVVLSTLDQEFEQSVILAVGQISLARTLRPQSMFTYCSSFVQMAASLRAKNDWNLCCFVGNAKGDTGGLRVEHPEFGACGRMGVGTVRVLQRLWTVTWTPPCCINVTTRSIGNKLWELCAGGWGG